MKTFKKIWSQCIALFILEWLAFYTYPIVLIYPPFAAMYVIEAMLIFMYVFWIYDLINKKDENSTPTVN